MSISQKLSDTVPTKSGKDCGMCLVLKVLSPKDHEAITAALYVPAGDPQRVTDKQIARILISEGYQISHNSIYRHRANHLEAL